MDAPETTSDHDDPHRLALARDCRRCLATTLRDLRRSAQRRRTMSLPNTLRLFERRWSAALTRQPLPLQTHHCLMRRQARQYLRRYYLHRQPCFVSC